jgi:hypothetical protein
VGKHKHSASRTKDRNVTSWDRSGVAKEAVWRDSYCACGEYMGAQFVRWVK